MRKLIKPENYCQDIDDKQESSVITTNDTEDMYYLEVIKVIGKDNDNNNIYLKFIEQKDGRQHPGYEASTIIEGFDYDKLMNHLNYRNNLNSMVCICETGEYLTNGCQNKVGPVETLEYLKNNFNRLKSDGLITSQKDFIMTPVYNGEFNKGHWTVAIISQGRIDMFDSTLQQKNTFKIDNKLLKCNETVNAKRQIQNENGKICGLCSAEFIIEASKFDSLEHLKQNINTICDKVATNVIEAIGQKNVEKQLTKDFQNNNEISPSREPTKNNAIDESQNVSKSKPIQQMKRGFSQTRTKTCKQRQTSKQQRPLPGKRAEMKGPVQK